MIAETTGVVTIGVVTIETTGAAPCPGTLPDVVWVIPAVAGEAAVAMNQQSGKTT